MSRPRLVDLFCSAGGATKGYQRAGFHVTGVDIRPQPNYCGDEFVQADALEFMAERWREFKAAHASPTCQTRARVTAWRGSREDHPDTLTPTLAMLRALPILWVVENVPEAAADGTLRPDLFLCGTMFGLSIKRHRVFETSRPVLQLTQPCGSHRHVLPFIHKNERAFADAMGCTWMSNKEARQAIPPAYTEYIGRLVLSTEERAA
jgi:hypothetical protein